jgi:hypothetical protein
VLIFGGVRGILAGTCPQRYQCHAKITQAVFKKSSSLATLAAMRLVSSRVSYLATAQCPGHVVTGAESAALFTRWLVMASKLTSLSNMGYFLLR